MPVPPPFQAPPTLLHRIRFLDHTPSPITALSFAPLPLPPSVKGKEKVVPGREELGALVVARENGEIELWEWQRGDEERSMGNWVLRKTLPPTLTHPTISLMALVIRDPANSHHRPYSVPHIADLRLFTAGSDSSDLAERCLVTGRVLSIQPIPSPPLWSLAVSPTHSLLCLATTSPSVHFLSIPPSGPLEPPPIELLRSDALPSRIRTVSVAWGVPSLIDGEWRDTYLITGNSDSSFRKWDIPPPPDPSRTAQGRVTIRARAVTEKVAKNLNGEKRRRRHDPKGTIVWGVGVLPDHTIVTSDSLGSVTFWDGASLAQKQTFRSHKADGMCLAIGPGGRTIFTSGPDQRICQFTLIPTSSGSEWHLTATKRVHVHDVRALAVFPPYTPLREPLNPSIAPVLASGGWDMSLVLTPAASPNPLAQTLKNPLGRSQGRSKMIFDEAFTRKMSCFGYGRICASRGARLVVGRKDRSVGIWRVLEDELGWEKVLEMDLRLRTNLIASAISNDGEWLALSDLYETKLFRLRASASGTAELHPIRVRTFLPSLLSSPLLSHLSFESHGTGSSSLLFTPDSQRLVLGLVHSGQVVVVELPNGDGKGDVNVLKCFTRNEAMVDGRVVKGRKARQRKVRKREQMGVQGDHGAGQVNGHSGTDSEDVEMIADGVVDVPNGQKEDQAEEDLPNGHTNGDSRHPQTPGPRRKRKHRATMSDGHLEAVQNGGGDLNGDEQSPDDDEGEADDASSSAEVQSLDASGAWISCMAASHDGQWLALCATSGRTSVFNLDTLQLHASLPTFPTPPAALLFAPSHPSLLGILLPTNNLIFYAIEDRRLLPPSQQIHTLNQALRPQYSPPQSASFEPSRSNPRSAKLIIWSHDWLCTARLDLDLIARTPGRKGSLMSPGSPSDVSRSLRRKRAREAREQLELVSASMSMSPSVQSSDRTGTGAGTSLRGQSSANDPESIRISNDGFRGVAGVEWLGEGELAVVERPYEDYVGELPAAFWSGGFGKR